MVDVHRGENVVVALPNGQFIQGQLALAADASRAGLAVPGGFYEPGSFGATACLIYRLGAHPDQLRLGWMAGFNTLLLRSVGACLSFEPYEGPAPPAPALDVVEALAAAAFGPAVAYTVEQDGRHLTSINLAEPFAAVTARRARVARETEERIRAEVAREIEEIEGRPGLPVLALSPDLHAKLLAAQEEVERDFADGIRHLLG